MDAVKFLEVYSRICSKHGGCVNCPLEGEPFCQCTGEKLSHEELERVVEVAENWNKENPEELGKKYIIEIDEVDGYTCRIKDISVWLGKSQLERLKEYKESEE
jgi:hypothetical protein